MNYFFGKKKSEYYDGLLIKSDLGLHEQIAATIVDEVPAGAEILDFGAGQGALSSRLVDLGYQVTAVDKDEAGFKSNKALFTCVDFDSPSQINNFVAQHEEQFDIVLGVEVIEHVQDQWQYIRQLMKMVKPGGLILITTPNTTSWLSRLAFLFTGQFHQFSDFNLSYGHISPISPWELCLILRESGAINIQVKSAGTLPPIYITGSLRLFFLNIFALLLRPFSTGILDGWCVLALARKPN